MSVPAGTPYRGAQWDRPIDQVKEDAMPYVIDGEGNIIYQASPWNDAAEALRATAVPTMERDSPEPTTETCRQCGTFRSMDDEPLTLVHGFRTAMVLMCERCMQHRAFVCEGCAEAFAMEWSGRQYVDGSVYCHPCAQEFNYCEVCEEYY